MAVLDQTNSTVDKETGAVMFHKSPELQLLTKLEKEVQEVNSKLDEVLRLLKGGGECEQ